MTREEFLIQLPELVKNYQPSPAVVSQIKNVSLLIVIGPSGVGKTTVIKKVGLPFVPPDTTRQPRPGEVDGRDYYFLKDYDRTIDDLKTGQFVQVVIGASGDLYASKASSYPTGGVALMTVMADVVPIFRQLGFRNTVSAFITPPSYDEWMRRMSEHGVEASQLDARLSEAYRSFNFALNDSETHFILNDNIEKAEHQLLELINGIIEGPREIEARKASQEIFSRLA